MERETDGWRGTSIAIILIIKINMVISIIIVNIVALIVAGGGGGGSGAHLEGVGPAARFIVQHLQKVSSALLRRAQLLNTQEVVSTL